MPDTIPETLFEQLYRRALTADDRRRLLDVKSALRLSDHDELWPLIMTLDHYSVIISAAENKIIQVFDEQLADVEAAVKASETAAIRNADRAVARAVQKGVEQLGTILAKKRSETTPARIIKKQFAIAATIGGLAAVAFLGIGWTAAHYYFETNFNICTGHVFRITDGGLGCYLR